MKRASPAKYHNAHTKPDIVGILFRWSSCQRLTLCFAGIRGCGQPHPCLTAAALPSRHRRSPARSADDGLALRPTATIPVPPVERRVVPVPPTPARRPSSNSHLVAPRAVRVSRLPSDGALSKEQKERGNTHGRSLRRIRLILPPPPKQGCPMLSCQMTTQ